jgi:hypothetical protein
MNLRQRLLRFLFLDEKRLGFFSDEGRRFFFLMKIGDFFFDEESPSEASQVP